MQEHLRQSQKNKKKKKRKSMPSLSADSIGFMLSKHAPVKSLGIMEASKAGESAGLATKASAMKLPAVIHAAACSRSCAGPKAEEGSLKCQVTDVG